MSDPYPIVGVDDVSLELGITPNADQTTIIQAAIRRAVGAIRSHIRYDPVYAQHTEFHPQQPFQAQISRGIWEVMEQRAVLRQVSEAATNELQLQHLPIREAKDGDGKSLLRVWVDHDGRSGARPGSFPASSLKSEGPDYWVNYDGYDGDGLRISRDGVLRTIGLWPTTPGTVKVQYHSGYSSDEFHGTAVDENGAAAVDATPIYDTALVESVRRSRKVLVQRAGRLGVMAGIFTSERLGDYSYSTDAKSLERLMGSDLLPESVQRLGPFVNLGYSLGS